MKLFYVERIIRFTLKSIHYDQQKLPYAVRAVLMAWDVQREKEVKNRHALTCPTCHRFIRAGEVHDHTDREIKEARSKATRYPLIFSREPLPVGTICRYPGKGVYFKVMERSDNCLSCCEGCDIKTLGGCARIKCGRFERQSFDGKAVYFKRVEHSCEGN